MTQVTRSPAVEGGTAGKGSTQALGRLTWRYIAGFQISSKEHVGFFISMLVYQGKSSDIICLWLTSALDWMCCKHSNSGNELGRTSTVGWTFKMFYKPVRSFIERSRKVATRQLLPIYMDKCPAPAVSFFHSIRKWRIPVRAAETPAFLSYFWVAKQLETDNSMPF